MSELQEVRQKKQIKKVLSRIVEVMEDNSDNEVTIYKDDATEVVTTALSSLGYKVKDGGYSRLMGDSVWNISWTKKDEDKTYKKTLELINSLKPDKV